MSAPGSRPELRAPAPRRSPLLDRLNPAQRAAASAPDGSTLVIAGAGTGKTQTLVHRVAWLIDQGVPPEGIVLLTFTRRAAAEMLERAAKLVGPRAKRVRGGTFHAFANTTLRRHARTIGYTAGFSVLDQEDATRLVATSRAAAGLAGKDRGFLPAAALAALWSLHRNTDRSLAELVTELQPDHASDLKDIERLMRSCDLRRKKLDVMDYDDLLVRFAELLYEHDAARSAVAGPIRHVLVDEYQDTNRLQAMIAGALSSEHGNLLVVGDEAQSIYAFRGATVRNILDFPKMFEECSTIVLAESYRSTTRILDLANAVLASAAEGFEKRLTSALGAGEHPEILETSDEEEQADEVVKRAVAAHKAGVPWSEIAVLVRAGFHSNLVEVELARRRIPFKKYGGLKFTDAAHTKDVLALLRVVANPRDELSWLRVLSILEGVGDKTAAKLAAEVVASGRLDPAPHRARKWGPALAHLAATLEAAATDAPADRAKRLVDWYRPALERLHDEPQRRAKDLETLELLAGRATDLQAFLADLALDPPLASEAGAEEDDDDDFLVISTIHSAKGLEWRVVFLLNLADGAFPSGQALDDRDRLEEERRLLYVAVTRAKERLLLGRPWSTRGRGWDEGGACRLLDDLPDLDRLTRPAKGGGKRGGDRGAARMDAFRDFFGRKRR